MTRSAIPIKDMLKTYSGNSRCTSTAFGLNWWTIFLANLKQCYASHPGLFLKYECIPGPKPDLTDWLDQDLVVVMFTILIVIFLTFTTLQTSWWTVVLWTLDQIVQPPKKKMLLFIIDTLTNSLFVWLNYTVKDLKCRMLFSWLNSIIHREKIMKGRNQAVEWMANYHHLIMKRHFRSLIQNDILPF